MLEQTLFLIKPNATEKHKIGAILKTVEENGFTIEALKMFTMDRSLAEEFYAEHTSKSFFEKLLAFMTSGKTVAAVLTCHNAVEKLRELVGNTEPKKAKPGTLRYLYGDHENMTRNAVHAADSVDHARKEIEIIFRK